MNKHCDVSLPALNSNHLKRNDVSSAGTTQPIQNSAAPPYRLRVLGIADQGAKSRVETQIRLELQLIDDNGNQPQQWSHIRLATSLLTLKRRNASTATLTTTTTSSSSPSPSSPTHNKKKSTLVLDQPSEPFSVPEKSMLHLNASVICDSDIHRTVKMCRRCVWREWKRADRKKTARKLGNTMYDETLMEKERHRILLFNSDPVLAFDQGECVLPTRITCYSRHHDERQGFRIKFMVHDHQGHLVASGTSAPIMITDDHKNLSKLGDKRRRRKTATKSTTPSPPSLPTPEEETLATFDESSVSLATQPVEAHDTPSSPGTIATIGLTDMDHHHTENSTTTMNESKNDSSYLMDPSGYLFDPDLFTPTLSPSLWSGTTSPTDTGSPVSSSPPSPTMTMMYSPYQQQQQQQPITLERMIPDQASIEGGTEITLLGSNFYEGMTWVFGDQPALMTTYWSSTTVVCTVPPATHPGPVLVGCLDSALWATTTTPSPSLVFIYRHQPAAVEATAGWDTASLTWQQLLDLNMPPHNHHHDALGLSHIPLL